MAITLDECSRLSALKFTKDGSLSVFARLLPSIWPYRKRLLLSSGFALLVAIFWGANLSLAFPVIKLLFEDETFEQYIDREMELAETERTNFSAILEQVQQQERALGDNTDDIHQVISLRNKKAKYLDKVEAANQQLAWLGWLKARLLPWVPKDKFQTFALILGILLIATAIKGTCIVIQDVLVGGTVELISMDLRKKCLRHTLNLDYQTISKEGIPNILSRFTYDLHLLNNGLVLLGGKIIREPLKALACIVGAFYVSWQLTLLSLLFAPLALLLFTKLGRSLKKATHRLMESMSQIYKTLEETISGYKVVTAYGNKYRHTAQFHRENKKYYQKSLKIVKINALTSPVTEMIGLVAAFVALLPCAYLLLKNETHIWGIRLAESPPDAATLALLYTLLAGVIDPIRKMSRVYTKLKHCTAAGERLFEFLDQPLVIQEVKEAASLPRLEKQIEFRDIDFSYATTEKNEGTTDVLRGVNLTIRHGETVVVVGENGSGKSTLVNLLPRFFDPTHGQVCLDGQDIRQARLDDLRKQISVVTQETILFDTTIAENIRYGNVRATKEELQQAADRAFVSSFVKEKEHGFDTIVGEKGGALSGGQRQRIALARAFIRNPSILILDEATSAIDAQSEKLIYEALQKFKTGRTILMITHAVRPSLLELADRFVVLDQGQLVATGTAEELSQSCPLFQSLVRANYEQETVSPVELTQKKVA